MPVAAGTKRKRGEGQWALGYREPLNKNEENKRNDDGLNVRQRIIDIYSKYGFDSIDPADLRGRFRWYGLYTQRRPGIDGGKTAVLEPEELDDRYFMLRVRIDGGRLSNDQLRVIAYISRRYARGTADVTDRQNIQLHWIEIENVPDIWEALESVGLSTTEACGDTPRVILGCPLAGIDADEIIDGTAEIAAIGEQYIGDAAFSNLPRKFKSAISGCPAQCAIHEINDIAFVGVVKPNGETGYDLWVGGGLSTNPMLAQKLGVPIVDLEVDRPLGHAGEEDRVEAGDEPPTARVILTTIHRAKGLEADFVHVAGLTDWLLPSRFRDTVIDRVRKRRETDHLAEELRILYVGMTRARLGQQPSRFLPRDGAWSRTVSHVPSHVGGADGRRGRWGRRPGA